MSPRPERPVFVSLSIGPSRPLAGLVQEIGFPAPLAKVAGQCGGFWLVLVHFFSSRQAFRPLLGVAGALLVGVAGALLVSVAVAP